MRRRRRRRPKPPDDLDGWEHGNDWIPTVITNDIKLPSHDEDEDINYPFYKTAFVLGHTSCPSADILSQAQINPQKVRSGKGKKKKKEIIQVHEDS